MNGRRGLVLDAGAFIALENRDEMMTRFVERIRHDGIPLITSAGVVARVWRGGKGKQEPIAFLLRRTTVIDLDGSVAKALGLVLGISGCTDPVIAHLVFLSRERGWPVLTSNPGALQAIDPRVEIEVI
jgi:hypothetical protein